MQHLYLQFWLWNVSFVRGKYLERQRTIAKTKPLTKLCMSGITVQHLVQLVPRLA